MNQTVIQGYADDAEEFVRRYEAISCAEMYSVVAHLFPKKAGRLIDIGAGTGRDAAWFAARGFEVVAVEPVAEFRTAGVSLHRSRRIAWLNDTLPELDLALQNGDTFDVVLVSGVWQHLDTQQRRVAMPNLAALVAPGGLVIMSLRHGPGAPERPCFPIPVDATIELAVTNGLELVFRQSTQSIQVQNRAAGVTWTWLVFSPVA
jgi:SAM-dependent methyltransferase